MTWKTELNDFTEQFVNLSKYARDLSLDDQLALLKGLSDSGRLGEDLTNAVDRTAKLSKPMFETQGDCSISELKDELCLLFDLIELDESVFDDEADIMTPISGHPTLSEALRTSLISTGDLNGGGGDLNGGGGDLNGGGGDLNGDPQQQTSPAIENPEDVKFSFIDGNDSFTVVARTKENYVEQVSGAIISNRNRGGAIPAWARGLSDESIRIFAGAKWDEAKNSDSVAGRVYSETTSKKTTFGA